MNSREKGKRGEREFRDVLREAGYCKARRGQQFSGGNESPDVICPELPTVHFEVKRCERGNPYDWISQAHEDAMRTEDFAWQKSFIIVAHKRNNSAWLAVLPMDDLLEIIRRSDLPQGSTPSAMPLQGHPSKPLDCQGIPVYEDVAHKGKADVR